MEIKSLAYLCFAAALLIFIGTFFVNSLSNWGPHSAASTKPKSNFKWLKAVPGTDIVRGGQPTADQLDSLLATGYIRTVIRLNGDGKDAGPLSVKAEKAICNRHGVTFVRMDAHAGYQDGIGYTKTIREALPYLYQEDVFIHCLHGYHRTGAVIGAYLSEKGWDEDDIIEHNGWKKLAQYPGQYYKYLETAGL